MKKSKLKKVIREEIQNILNEEIERMQPLEVSNLGQDHPVKEFLYEVQKSPGEIEYVNYNPDRTTPENGEWEIIFNKRASLSFNPEKISGRHNWSINGVRIGKDIAVVINNM